MVDADCLPQTLAVLATRLAPLGIDVEVADLGAGLPSGDFFGVVQQYPGASGAIRDFAAVTAEAHGRGALVTVAADLLALTLLRPPGEWGADVVVGSSQRFGVPLWYGGPHAAFMAVKAGLERDLPGAWSGCRSTPRTARPTAWPCRHASSTSGARRRRRTSARRRCCWPWWPPCTPCTTAPRACAASRGGCTPGRSPLARGLEAAGFDLAHPEFFDTLAVTVPGRAAAIVAAAAERGVLLRLVDDDHVGLSCGETTTAAHVAAVLEAFGAADASREGAGPHMHCQRTCYAGAPS